MIFVSPPASLELNVINLACISFNAHQAVFLIQFKCLSKSCVSILNPKDKSTCGPKEVIVIEARNGQFWSEKSLFDCVRHDHIQHVHEDCMFLPVSFSPVSAGGFLTCYEACDMKPYSTLLCFGEEQQIPKVSKNGFIYLFNIRPLPWFCCNKGIN